MSQRLTWRQVCEMGCLIKGDVPTRCSEIDKIVGRDGWGVFKGILEESRCRFTSGYDRFDVAIDSLDNPVHSNFVIFIPLGDK